MDDYVNAVEHTVTINSQTWTIPEVGVGELEQDPKSVKRRIWLSIGSPTPGEYDVATSQSLCEAIVDG